MNISSTINFKELHAKTGEHVRRASKNRHPILITDHGKGIAFLVSANLFQKKRPKRTLLPGYKKIMNKRFSGSVLEDLDAIRGERL